MGTKIFMKLHSNFYNLIALGDGQFKKEVPYVMNGKMKLLLTEFAVPSFPIIARLRDFLN